MKKNLSFLLQPPTPSEKGFPFPRCQIALQTMPFTCYRRFCVKLAWRRHHYSCPRLSSGLMDTRFIQRRRQWHPTPVLLPGKSHRWRSLVGCSPRGHEESDTTEQHHFHFYALEKEMATHSSVLAWRIPGIAEPGGLPSMGSHRVGHD